MHVEPVTSRNPPELGCPACHMPLQAAGDEFRCATHGVLARRSPDGIFEFDRGEHYWGEVDRETMQRIDAAARRTSWREAIALHLAPQHPDLVEYVQHPARGDWNLLLPLDRERTVAVDVGAGWGANSFALLPHVRRVYAVEKIGERIEFLALRARQDGAERLVPVRADLHALPFAAGSVDLFVVNGVLEWAGLVDPLAGPEASPRGPRLLQEIFLRQLWGLLRPGGWIYVGIENRFGRIYWKGGPDHQGLRYTSLMPRPMARAYTFVRAITSSRTHRTERDYRTYTYSLGGYRKLLRACGFEAVQSYASVPGYNVPTRLVPLATTGPLEWLASRSRSPRRIRGVCVRALRRAAARIGLEARVSTCYAFVAQRPAPPGTRRAP
jgi:SAM-dependent methyltransferase